MSYRTHRSRTFTRHGGRVALLVMSVAATGATLSACGNGEEPTDAKGTTPAVVSGQQAPTQGEGGAEAGSASGESESESGDAGGGLKASLINPSGSQIGTAELTTASDGVKVTVTVRKGSGLTAGFHGLHLHAMGVCADNSTPPTGGAPGAFLSAGGHLQVNGRTEHPASGDLVSIHISGDGSGETVTTTDMVTLDQVAGKAIMIHAGPDNFANIPQRYAPAPDQETLSTGDAGARVACGVLNRG